MQEETPLTSLKEAVPAGRIVARLSATLQQTEQACAELSRLESLLSSLSSGAADLVRASTTSVDTEMAEPSQMTRNAGERTEEVYPSLEATGEPATNESEVWRTWCSASEVSNAFHSSGLSTSFSALERSVSDAMVLALPSKLQRITEKVKQLCSTLGERARRARQKQVLAQVRARWTCEAVRALHQIAHAPLEPEYAEAAKLSLAVPCDPLSSVPQEAHNLGKSRALPGADDAVWWELHAGLHGVLHRTVLSSASSAVGKNEEVAEGRLKLQRQRLLALLEEMTMWLVDDTSATR
ncbi:conserved hypothetical protein [Leishmania major strain Friedlin]|uniref:Uncharacterized protein n=1 Tax=Leishmania major TaxID=5664 RepID=Q4Q0L2_LEIMA|nr:conserved hypothetical protein [Leishmania major strain Friedlin]CAG9584102.1 hypothetical_protein_-_conserved [Leishmania major strain Friedlin]CAJ09522.1 conserved hypothetical protein [Leishmania major strain Friedlin]|eukprot:XP_001687136.1 conserved hypothetical protein [Leishmania major strain Friedlin]